MKKTIAIFCGSSLGADPEYGDAVAKLGQSLARNDIGIVYGGGRVGLMGRLADSVLAEGGSVTGVIPRMLLEVELAHPALTALHVVDSLQERKTKMANLSDAFIALPGGAGTLDEIVEQWTWAQLGIHQKPCAFLNAKQYFAPLQALVEHFVRQGFTPKKHADMLIFSHDIDEILERIENYVSPPLKWSREDAVVNV